VLRFGLYFVGVRRDPKAFLEWLRLLRQGRREHFFRR
jgi:rhamnopyranosyl-N-acetylglucosaminyl-diphospho-decaprenol beta-1,3/1,4-galactofuranosyltransferase